MDRRIAATAIAGLLVSCTPQPLPQPPVALDTPAPSNVPPPRPEKTHFAGNPPPAYMLCATCHTTAKGGPNGLGPNLWGVFNARAAHEPGYRYSDQLRAAGIEWNDETLDRWLANPKAMVPGTKMFFGGVADPAKRRELIAYLKSLN